MKMVRLGSLLSIALLPLTLVTASPTAELETRHDKHACISDREAKDLLNTYVSLFTDIRPDVARDLLVPNFQEFSASINFLFGQSVSTALTPHISPC